MVIIGYFLPVFYKMVQAPQYMSMTSFQPNYTYKLIPARATFRTLKEHVNIFDGLLFYFIVNNQFIIVLILIFFSLYYKSKNKILSRIFAIILLIFIVFLILLMMGYFEELKLSMYSSLIIFGAFVLAFGKD